jgi:alkylation response protein AidB-like acyl-CoA dehydrogenase
MNFDLTDDQKMLVETAASFARKQSPVSRARKLRGDPIGWEPAVWRQMGELGWLGVMFGDDVGGFGGRFGDAALVIEQLGSTLVPEPYLPSVVLGGGALARGGTPAQRSRWLAPMVAGQTSLALGFAEAGARFEPTSVATRATRDGSGWRLSGGKRWVLNGHAADQIIVSARTAGGDDERAGITLFVVERNAAAAGLRVQPVATMDGRRAAMIDLDGVSVPADAVLGGDDGVDRGGEVLERVLDLGAAAAVSEGVGIAAAVLTMTVAYLKTREQFGKKIGAFQALQHRAVDMFVHVELLRSMAILGAIEADSDDALARAEAVSSAKVQLGNSGRWVVRQGIQLHGGIGCTDEHDVGLYFKRMHVLAALFGDDEHHVTRFASLPGFRAGVRPGLAAQSRVE